MSKTGIRDGAYFRRKRLEQIARIIAKGFTESKTEPPSLNYRNLLKAIQFQLGLSEQKAREYVALTCEVKGSWELSEKDNTITLRLEEEGSKE